MSGPLSRGQKRVNTDTSSTKGLWHKNFQRFWLPGGFGQKLPYLSHIF